MLSVIIDARRGAPELPVLLAQLTAGAVDGLVRQVLLVAGPGQAGIDLLCEETGAEAHDSLEAAAAAARAEWLVVAPADFRLRDGWIKALETHLAAGGGAALVSGLGPGGLLGRSPWAVLVERRRLEHRRGADLKRLRRDLGLRPVRIG
ncbi:cell wall biosynthesis glycosyltransferase [Phenylobacterium sp. SCN 70-31]|uniref:cell wall biosynthesis glycosyltransferase n=1 Tax=Phenylobacterium sp. SCN 70-31 TaxID=1660129 RepID=UPI00086EE07B|nr:cell wall biosynthesis glycosyltransferase [Phenylobacterium sp. SCN 70-31]ODT86663.1 MAG: hypothetical protein ABS78_15365 [Phenylobacterium sp. SCN 70-31]